VKSFLGIVAIVLVMSALLSLGTVLFFYILGISFPILAAIVGWATIMFAVLFCGLIIGKNDV
jgi:hypothetical protein